MKSIIETVMGKEFNWKRKSNDFTLTVSIWLMHKKLFQQVPIKLRHEKCHRILTSLQEEAKAAVDD